MSDTLPLFPLNTVLFPGGPLELRIFEPRYLDMVSACLKRDQGFGVCLIAEGAEAGAARTYTVGTLAKVYDWNQGADDLLHIRALGSKRFRILRLRTQHDGLNLGEVEWLPDPPLAPLPDSMRTLADRLRALLARMPERYAAMATAYDDALWVGSRLAEILPLTLSQRQNLLEINDARMRLDVLQALIAPQTMT